MKKHHSLILFILLASIASIPAFTQTSNTGNDFIPGNQVIFEDQFEQDLVGDLPAKWSTSGAGELVTLDRLPGKWFKISQPTAVSPELPEALPENCTIEFDLYLKNTTGISPHIMFGLTTLSDVAAGDVYREHIWVVMRGYSDNRVEFGKTIQNLGSKPFRLGGYVGRKLHVSIAINKTRFRVYLDKQKVVDLPKLLSDEYRNNFFIASSTVIPEAEEGVYFSNVRIASGEVDARSLLVKQLLEQGSVVTGDISFTQQTNTLTPESQPILDTLGQVLVADPSLNIQINGADLPPGDTNVNPNVQNSGGMLSDEAIKQKVDKIKEYLINKFNIGVDRIVTGVTKKAREKINELKNSKSGSKVRGFLTEIIKL